MHDISHNGGPPLEISGKMRWVRINISDILEGMDGLDWEQRGFYVTLLFKMYARMDGIPADDAMGAAAMRCNPRTFRRLREQLISAGKLYRDDGVLRNGRVEREITDFCREVKRRREAALEREQRRREARATQAIRPEFDLNSHRIRPEFDLNSTGTISPFDPNADDLPNEINGCNATAVPSQTHMCGGNQKPETRNQKEKKELVCVSRASAREVPHMNGVGFVISEQNNLVIPQETIAKWQGRFKHIPDLEAELQGLAAHMLAKGGMHPGWTCPEGWMAGCLAKNNKRYEEDTGVAVAKVAKAQRVTHRGPSPEVLKAQNEKLRRENGWTEETKNG